jgi:hypothetical protein
MASERTPILPSTAQPPQSAHPRRRIALIIVGVVALVTLVIIVLNLSYNFPRAKRSIGSTLLYSSLTTSKMALVSQIPALIQYCTNGHEKKRVAMEAGCAGTMVVEIAMA